jgi:hypothetical protein
LPADKTSCAIATTGVMDSPMRNCASSSHLRSATSIGGSPRNDERESVGRVSIGARVRAAWFCRRRVTQKLQSNEIGFSCRRSISAMPPDRLTALSLSLEAQCPGARRSIAKNSHRPDGTASREFTLDAVATVGGL